VVLVPVLVLVLLVLVPLLVLLVVMKCAALTACREADVRWGDGRRSLLHTLSVCWRAGEAARQHQVGLAAPSQTNSWLAAVG